MMINKIQEDVYAKKITSHTVNVDDVYTPFWLNVVSALKAPTNISASRCCTIENGS